MSDRYNLEHRLRLIKADFDKVYQELKLADKLAKLKTEEQTINSSEIWNNPETAQELIKLFKARQATVLPWQTLKIQIDDYGDLMDLGDDSMLCEIDGQLIAMERNFSKLKQDLLFKGAFDDNPVILRITSGVGGLDAEDFTQMLERMYLRYFENHGYQVDLIERRTGEENGLKTAVYEVTGPFAYGRLKGEHGVHRLVRKSPFNSDNLRQTSFSLVEILPKIDNEHLEIDQKDLKIDFFRAGGHGGQSVNTTDSAVRITHLPTGLVASIQNERSQLQNRATAMAILRAKLFDLKEAQHVDNLNQLKAGESASWGGQIRNYVFHPYTLVKDTRTKFEDRDITKVMDGDLDPFINAYLEHIVGSTNR